MSLVDCEEVPRKVCPIIFIVETSSAMHDSMIGAINLFIRENLSMLNYFGQRNNVNVKFNVLSFSTGAKWMYGKMISVSDFKYQDLIAGGNVELGAAFDALDEALSCDMLGDFLAISSPYYILFSANFPTDDYQTALSKLKANIRFIGVKSAIAIGNNADKNILVAFTGNLEAVIDSSEVDSLSFIFSCINDEFLDYYLDDFFESNFEKKVSNNIYEYKVLIMNTGQDELEEDKKKLEADLDVFEETEYALKKTIAIKNQIVVILQKEINEIFNDDHWD